jgi:hypothetical protein
MATKKRKPEGARKAAKSITPTSAREFISRAALPQARVSRDGAAEALTLAEMGFDTAKNQAAVVGSEIVSFVTGVTAERREAIVNSSLLAQLVAKKAVPDATDIDAWYRVYFDTLLQLGWVMQDFEFKKYVEQSQSFDAHKAILEVAALFMGPAAPTALAVLKTTLEALQSMDADNPWITLFDRESRSATVARFQIAIAEQVAGGQFIVRTMAFALSASSTITQVLFFKARQSGTELRYHSGKVTINSGVLDSVGADLKAKLAAHAHNFIRTLPDL